MTGVFGSTRAAVIESPTPARGGIRRRVGKAGDEIQRRGREARHRRRIGEARSQLRIGEIHSSGRARAVEFHFSESEASAIRSFDEEHFVDGWKKRPTGSEALTRNVVAVGGGVVAVIDRIAKGAVEVLQTVRSGAAIGALFHDDVRDSVAGNVELRVSCDDLRFARSGEWKHDREQNCCE